MKLFTLLASWFIWALSAFLASIIAVAGPNLWQNPKVHEAARNAPMQINVAIVTVIMLISFGALYMRLHWYHRTRTLAVLDFAGAAIWLCLLSFALCFALAGGLLGVCVGITEGSVPMVYIFQGIAAFLLLASLPLLPSSK